MTQKYRPVAVPRDAFAFCRYTMAILLWLALVLHVRWLLAVAGLIMGWSYLVGVKRAPLVAGYAATVGRLVPSPDITLDARGIRFAHGVATIMSAIALVLLYLVNERFGWWFVACFALLKTSAAFGRCGALKLYGCMTGTGSCCRVGKMLHVR